MSKTVPPETIDISKLAYDPMYASDGSIVVNAGGIPLSQKLTDEQKERIHELVLEGMNLLQIAKEVRTTKNRVMEYLNKPKANEAIQRRALTVNLVQTTKAQSEQIALLVDLIATMEKRLSNVQSELKQVRFLAYRQKTGRWKAERENRSQRQQVNRLRNQIWKRTGKDPI